MTGRGGTVLVDRDEQPGKARPDKIPDCAPLSRRWHDHGGQFCVIRMGRRRTGACPAKRRRERGTVPQARYRSTAAHAHAPALFTTAPVFAIRKVLERAGWSVTDVDLFEVNEAFAAVAMIAMHDLGIPRDRMNVNGGATALGHPIGASGARIIVTLIAALPGRGLRRGVAALCIGGGEATAIAIELI